MKVLDRVEYNPLARCIYPRTILIFNTRIIILGKIFIVTFLREKQIVKNVIRCKYRKIFSVQFIIIIITRRTRHTVNTSRHGFSFASVKIERFHFYFRRLKTIIREIE